MSAPRNARARSRAEASKGPRHPKGSKHPSEQGAGSQRSPQDALPLTASQLLTAEQLAQRWQVPKTQVWRLARDGAVPVVRIGRYMRFRRDVIERWEQEQANA